MTLLHALFSGNARQRIASAIVKIGQPAEAGAFSSVMRFIHMYVYFKHPNEKYCYLRFAAAIILRQGS